MAKDMPKLLIALFIDKIKRTLFLKLLRVCETFASYLHRINMLHNRASRTI